MIIMALRVLYFLSIIIEFSIFIFANGLHISWGAKGQNLDRKNEKGSALFDDSPVMFPPWFSPCAAEVDACVGRTFMFRF